MALEHWLQMALTDGLGPILQRRIIELTGSVEQACRAGAAVLRQVEGIGAGKAQKIADSLKSAAEAAEGEWARARRAGIGLICPDDAAYPTLLRDISDPPAVLYVKGPLEPRDLNALALVGSRKCSFYGREQSERFAALLAGAGFTVISGGARGVDTAAHRGALAHPQGRTIAVLGCGVDMAYPPENAKLFEQIAERGAVISEYPLGTPPLADNFPRRNRIVSGMSRGVLVVEADERSGALITARLAADDHNRPVFAIPGRVDNALSAGPHRLIRDGAILTRSLEDILEGLTPLPQGAHEPTLFESAPQAPPPAPEHVALPAVQRKILDAMDHEPLDVDALVQRTGSSAQEVLGTLTMLSLRGLIQRLEGQTYVRREKR